MEKKIVDIVSMEVTNHFKLHRQISEGNEKKFTKKWLINAF